MDEGEFRCQHQSLMEAMGKLLRNTISRGSLNFEFVAKHATASSDKRWRKDAPAQKRCCPIGRPHYEVEATNTNCALLGVGAASDFKVALANVCDGVLQPNAFGIDVTTGARMRMHRSSLLSRVSLTLSHADALMRQLDERFAKMPWRSIRDLVHLKACKRIAFVDCETLGFRSAPVFLIGAIVWDRDLGNVELHQLLAHDYSEEPLIIEALLSLAADCGFVTFNGKAFDVPLLRARSMLYGIRWSEPSVHLDLLHLSRRLWRRRLENFRLSTLCTAFCHPVSVPPSYELPELYRRFVECPNEWLRVMLLAHNANDVCALATLLSAALWCIAACKRCATG